MKSLFLRLVLPVAAMAFIAPGTALAQKGAGGSATVIPGGTFATPYVINQPGSYVLGGNRVSSDPAKHVIEITAQDVTLDLGGFTLSHPAGNAAAGAGIYIPATENVEIRNGSIVNSRRSGVWAPSGKGLRVVEMRFVSPRVSGVETLVSAASFDRCYVADSFTHGINAKGSATVIRDCVISSSGQGISLGANGSRVIRTTVQGGWIGITVGANSTAADCIVTGASQMGIYTGAHTTLRNVEVMDSAVGVYSSAATLHIIGSRISDNPVNIQGAYTSGGGNVIQ